VPLNAYPVTILGERRRKEKDSSLPRFGSIRQGTQGKNAHFPTRAEKHPPRGQGGKRSKDYKRKKKHPTQNKKKHPNRKLALNEGQISGTAVVPSVLTEGVGKKI